LQLIAFRVQTDETISVLYCYV